jgi:lysophospholipase L1-like esterase
MYRGWKEAEILPSAKEWEPYLEQQHGIRFGKELGCGYFGCAYEAKGKPGWAIKVTSDMKELVASNLISALPAKDPRKRILPDIYDAYVQDLAGARLAVIVREDVVDLSAAEKDWWGHCGRAKITKLTLTELARKNCRGEEPPTARMQTFVDAVDEMVELGKARGADWILNDLHRSNLGVTHGGRVVVRDIGESYIGSAAPFLAGLSGVTDWARGHKSWLLVGGALLGAFLLLPRGNVGTIPNTPRRGAALGDSITANGAYLDELAKHLPAGSVTRKWGYAGQGVDVIKAHAAEVLAWQPTDVVVLAGVNNLPASRPAPYVGNITRGLQDIYDQLKAAGVRLVAVEVLPWGGYQTANEYGKARWSNLNAWIRGSAGPDVVVDASTAVGVSGKLLPSLTHDGLHPNAMGHVLLGQAIAEQAFRVG